MKTNTAKKAVVPTATKTVAPTTALAVTAPKFSLQTAVATARQQLARIADEAGKELAPPALLNVYNQLADLLSIGDSINTLVKGKLKALVVDKGTQVTDAGSRRVQVAGYKLEVRPLHTGHDPRKVEKLLRAKGAPVDRYMGKDIKYKVVPDMLITAVEEKVLTADELATCLYDESWAFQPPKLWEE